MAALTSFKNACEQIPPCTTIWDDWNHRLFCISNEKQRSETLKKMEQLPLNGNIAIGVSGLEILNQASVRFKSDKQYYIVLLDRGIRTEKFWKTAENIITKSNSRSEVFAGICKDLWDSRNFYFKGIQQNQLKKFGLDQAHAIEDNIAGAEIHLLKKDIKKGVSWLATDERYLRIKKIFDDKHFVFKRVDWLESDAIQQLGLAFMQQGLQSDFIYFSNILEYIPKKTEHANTLVKNLSTLSNGKTIFIGTNYRNCTDCQALFQKVFSLPKSQNPLSNPSAHEIIENVVKKLLPMDIPCTCPDYLDDHASFFDRKNRKVEVDLKDYDFRFVLPWTIFIQVISYNGDHL